jgi:CAAX protease family protein
MEAASSGRVLPWAAGEQLGSRSRSRQVVLAVAVIVAFLAIDNVRRALGLWPAFAAVRPGEVQVSLWKAAQVVLCVAAVAMGYRRGITFTLRELGLRRGALAAFGWMLVATSPMLVGFAALDGVNPSISAARLVMTGLASPLSEELLFRGFLFRHLYVHARWPFWAAVLANALNFGLGHLYQAEGAGLLGGLGVVAATGTGAAFFAWLLMRWNQSLWAPIALHALMNVGSYVFAAGDSVLSRPSNITVLSVAMVSVAAVTVWRTGGWRVTRPEVT